MAPEPIASTPASYRVDGNSTGIEGAPSPDPRHPYFGSIEPKRLRQQLMSPGATGRSARITKSQYIP
jgi:hypothetical protein